MANLIAEFEAIRRAARDPGRRPYQFEIPDAGTFGTADQRHDPGRLKTILDDVVRPQGVRSSEAFIELARRNRAWPKQTHAVFHQYIQEAVDAGETLSLSKLATDLPANLASSFANLSEKVWKRQGQALERRQELTKGHGLSY